jgi:hypothetical protein
MVESHRVNALTPVGADVDQDFVGRELDPGKALKVVIERQTPCAQVCLQHMVAQRTHRREVDLQCLKDRSDAHVGHAGGKSVTKVR